MTFQIKGGECLFTSAKWRGMELLRFLAILSDWMGLVDVDGLLMEYIGGRCEGIGTGTLLSWAQRRVGGCEMGKIRNARGKERRDRARAQSFIEVGHFRGINLIFKQRKEYNQTAVG